MDAILGLDFLEENNCVLNLAEGKIMIGSRSVPFWPISTLPRYVTARLHWQIMSTYHQEVKWKSQVQYGGYMAH